LLNNIIIFSYIFTPRYFIIKNEGDSFKEIKDGAKALYAEISDTEYGGGVTEMPIRYHAET
jgi:hypothetical protein